MEVVSIPFDDISDTCPAESSKRIRDCVIKARNIQEKRFSREKGIYCNAQIHTRLL